jgi:LysM repeat protein
MFVRVVLAVVLAALLVAVAARRSDGAGPERTYVVRPADTLWSIAVDHYGGDPRAAVWRLQERNQLASPLVRPGQRLVLPAG